MFENIKNQFPEMVLKENESLKNHTTFKIGGPAKFFAEVNRTDVLKALLVEAKANNIAWTMIGGGSNILAADNGFDGLVIKLIPGEMTVQDETVTVWAGNYLAVVLQSVLSAGLTGMEFSAGIPGTIGGAVKGNAGTYGEDMGKVIEIVNFLDENFAEKQCLNNECGFTYRHSIFKDHADWLITSVILKLERGDLEASKKIVMERLKKRTCQPPEPSAGCIFKNIIWTEEIQSKLEKLGWEPQGDFKKHGKIPTAWLIDNLDLKGKTIGRAQVSPIHANYIVNLGDATADEVMQLISVIKQKARNTAGIQLHEEVRYLGFE